MGYEIVTDSSADLTDELIEQYGIHIVSLSFRVGGEEFPCYVQGEKTDYKQFYDRMRKGEMVDTSLIDMSTCRDIFEGILKRGNDVLYIGFSSALSGSYNAGTMVAESLRDAYPERKIATIDSLSASMGEGLLVYHVAEQRRAGKSIDEVSDWGHVLSSGVNCRCDPPRIQTSESPLTS